MVQTEVPQETPSKSVPENVILPPPEIRNVVDKTANFVARNGIQFEEKIRENEKNNPKFYFLNPKDPYHAYYQWRLVDFKEGRAQAPAGTSLAGSSQQDQKISDLTSAASSAQPTPPTIIVTPPVPPSLEFMLDIPPMSSQDFDILKLTAQFVAKNGRQFMNHLAQRESRNHQFDFLKPSHPLFALFNKLVDQFTKVLSPSVELTHVLWWNVEDQFQILNRIQQRANYIQWQEGQRQKVEEEKEKERMAFASIDWHSFVVVDTIAIDETDFESELPAPTSLLELQCFSLQQRRKEIPSYPDGGETVSTEPTQDDRGMDLDHELPPNEFKDPASFTAYNKQSAHLPSSPPLSAPTSLAGIPLPDDPTPPRLTSVLPPEPKATSGGVLRIKKEVVPRKHKIDESTQVCPRCGQSILVSEMEEHMRIELLDPKWREQRQAYEQSRRETNLSKEGEQVVHSLRTFAEYRKDIFGGDEVDLQKKIEEDLERQRELSKKKVIWDGHTASIATATQKVKEIVPLDEQIMSIHKAKGLIEETNVPGPTAPWVHAPSSYPPMYPVLPHPSFTGPQPSMFPTHLIKASQYHLRPEDEEEQEYEAKRQKVMDVLVHEDTWISQHPHTIMLHLQVPEVKEYALCTGQWMALEFSLRQTVYQVKEQIASILQVPLQQIHLGVPITGPEGTEIIFTKNHFTLAYYNLKETTNAILNIHA